MSIVARVSMGSAERLVVDCAAPSGMTQLARFCGSSLFLLPSPTISRRPLRVLLLLRLRKATAATAPSSLTTTATNSTTSNNSTPTFRGSVAPSLPQSPHTRSFLSLTRLTGGSSLPLDWPQKGCSEGSTHLLMVYASTMQSLTSSSIFSVYPRLMMMCQSTVVTSFVKQCRTGWFLSAT